MFLKIYQHIQSTLRRTKPILRRTKPILKRVKTTLIIGTLSWNTTPQALAQEVKIPNQQNPVCQEKQVNKREYQKPSALKMQRIIKSHPDREDTKSSGQDEESCQPPYTPETTESPQPLGTPETSSDEDLSDSQNGTDSSDNDPINPDQSTSTQPSISNTDSHDVNFSIQLNTGGGTSPDSGLSLPEGNILPTVEPDPSSPIPSQPLPNGETNPASESLSPQPKKPQKTKHKKGEQNKPNKSHKDKKDPKHDRLNRRMNKPDKSPLEESKQVNKSERKTNPNTHRNPLKQLRDSETQNNSYQDRLPSMRRKPNAQKPRVKGYRSELHPIHQQKMRETIRPNLNHPTDSSPKIYTPRVHRQLPHSLKNRPHLHPRIRKNMSPHKVFRPSAPGIPRTHRRAR